jgi:cytochrome c6
LTLLSELAMETYAFGILENHKHQFSLAKAAANTASMTVLASTLLLVSLASPASAGDIGRGEILFTGNCASCHMGGTNVVNEQRTLKKDALEQFGIGLDQPGIQTFVTNSMRHKNLVFFRVEGGKLTPSQWEDVTTYISDQAKGDKW